MKNNGKSEGNHFDGFLDHLLEARFSHFLHDLDATVPEALRHKINEVDAMASFKDVDQGLKTNTIPKHNPQSVTARKLPDRTSLTPCWAAPRSGHSLR